MGFQSKMGATATKTSLKKWSRAAPNFYLVYFISFNSSNVGNFFCSWILKDCIKVQEKKRKVVVLCSRPRQNEKIGTFTLQSCNDGQEMYRFKRKCNARAELLFCKSKPTAFLPFSLPSPSSLSFLFNKHGLRDRPKNIHREKPGIKGKIWAGMTWWKTLLDTRTLRTRC